MKKWVIWVIVGGGIVLIVCGIYFFVYERDPEIRNKRCSDVSDCKLFGDGGVNRWKCYNKDADEIIQLFVEDVGIWPDEGVQFRPFECECEKRKCVLKLKDGVVDDCLEGVNKTGRPRSTCIRLLARDLLDETLCEYAGGNLTDQYSEVDKCYMYLAVEKKDKSICDNSKSQEMVDYCYQKYDHLMKG
jgi:hypothetical protein